MKTRPPRILGALVAAAGTWWRPAARGSAALAIATVLAGCGQSGAMVVAPAPTLPPPTPAGMQDMAAQPPLRPDKTADD